MNPLHLIDWYKADHRRQYPEGTSLVFSNLTPRKSRIPGVNYTVFFGLQYFIRQYLIREWQQNFFDKPLESVLNAYRRRVENSLGKDAITYEHIAALHSLGYLPIEIWALPEGVSVPIGVPPMVMWNTHPDFFWLVNYLETVLSCTLWQACTSATIAKEYRKLFNSWADKTGGSKDFVQFQGHDFSMRGMSSVESACLSGAGHLLSFVGTDCVPAIDFLEEYYDANSDKELIGCSVPATEHSVMCAAGPFMEPYTFKRMLELYPKGIVSIVSDTWNFWDVLYSILPDLKPQIMAREGKVVIRPDSSKTTPADIICGNPNAKESIEQLGAIEVLGNIFGSTVNSKGFKELDPHIGLIYGDSITLALADEICRRLEAKGWASTNWVAGIGSYTYQYNTRDTFGWAMKATYCEADGQGREIFKDPVTDSGFKKSAKGLIAVYQKDGTYVMKDQATWDDVRDCAYAPVFRNSAMKRLESLEEIRARI